MIQFACPSCSSTCGVDDRFKGRKIKCPKCGARVLHVSEGRVELLTPGSAQPPKPPPAAPGAAPAVAASPGEATPMATAVLPHSVGEFVQASESKQNLYIGAGLLGFFALVLIVLGFILDNKLLIVIPIAVLLVAVAAYLVWHTRKLKGRLAQIAERKSAGPPKPGPSA